MFGYNETGEAQALRDLISFCATVRDRFADSIANAGQLYAEATKDPMGVTSARAEVWYLLALMDQFKELRARSAYAEDVWKARPYELLTGFGGQLPVPEGGSGAASPPDEFLREDSIFHTVNYPADEAERSRLVRAYHWSAQLSAVRMAEQFFLRTLPEILGTKGKKDGPDAPSESMDALVEAYEEWRRNRTGDHPIVAEFQRGFRPDSTACARQQLDVFDNQISIVERIARSRLSGLSQDSEVILPCQVAENEAANAELALCMALVYASLCRQGVTGEMLKPASGNQGFHWFPLPGGQEGFYLYTMGFSSDTYRNRVNAALKRFGDHPPIRFATIHQVAMVWMDESYFHYFERALAHHRKADRGMTGDITEAEGTMAHTQRAQSVGDAESSRIRALLQAQPFLRSLSPEACVSSSTSAIEPPGKTAPFGRENEPERQDVILKDDGGRMCYMQLASLFLERLPKTQPAPVAQEDPGRRIFSAFIQAKAQGTVEEWVEQLPNMNALVRSASQALVGLDGIDINIVPAKNYSKFFSREDGVGRYLMMFLYYRECVEKGPGEDGSVCMRQIAGEDYPAFLRFRQWIADERIDRHFRLSMARTGDGAYRLTAEKKAASKARGKKTESKARPSDDSLLPDARIEMSKA